mmetsp:Transcript_26804/g.53495  ORF Transcript_26804/g.53495 Transcript_26804/m.53495 type:complete len:367 (+) Transcript_26804:162-1262(+)
MTLSYDDALSTLTAMFGAPWDQDSLSKILRHHGGHMENTVDMVLTHGAENSPSSLIDKIEGRSGGGGGGVSAAPAASATALDAAIALQLAEEEEEDLERRIQAAERSSPGRRTFDGGVRGNSQRGLSRRVAAQPPPPPTPPVVPAPRPQSKGRGTPTDLPDDFLRVPGFVPTTDFSAAPMDDEQLARMIMADEEMLAQLERRDGGGRLFPPRTATTAGTAASPGTAWGGARGATMGSNMRGGPTGQQQPGPLPSGEEIMKKLGEMGNNAKRTLALFAANINARNNRNAGNRMTGGGRGGGPPPTSSPATADAGGRREMRGLLSVTGDDDDDYEEMSFVGPGGRPAANAFEMGNFSSGSYGHKKKDD